MHKLQIFFFVPKQKKNTNSNRLEEMKKYSFFWIKYKKQ